LLCYIWIFKKKSPNSCLLTKGALGDFIIHLGLHITMKNRDLIFCLLLWIVLTGCGATRAIYGVPEVQWTRMNETERQATIDYFKQQQEINAATRIQAEKAREEAEEFASQCHDVEKYEHPSEKCEVIQRHRWLFQQ